MGSPGLQPYAAQAQYDPLLRRPLAPLWRVIRGPLVSAPASVRRHRRWWFAGGGVLVLALAAVAILLALAASYQPLGWGSIGNDAMRFPGLPAGVGIHPVNTFGDIHSDYYIPPQRGEFSLYADVYNNGPYAVTIVSVRPWPPGSPLGWPLKLAGPVRYSTSAMARNGLRASNTRVLHDVSLAPGEEMYIGIPVRMWPCAYKDMWWTIPSYYVTERFLWFTQTIALPWSAPPQNGQLVMNPPGGRPGQPGVFCAKR